jgi:putative serine protease PepD
VADGVALIVKIRSFEPGDSITLTVQRGGDSRRYDVKLGSQVG